MSLKETPGNSRELQKYPIFLRANLSVSPGVAPWRHARSVIHWGSLICIMLHHRTMSISASSELMHQDGKWSCPPELLSGANASTEVFCSLEFRTPPLFPVPL